MEIQIRRIAESSIYLEIPIQSDIDLIILWQKRIITDILLLAYLNQPATFITIDPDKNSVGNEYPHKRVTYKKKSFLINHISICKHIDLIKLGESSDLELGLLSITSLLPEHIDAYNLLQLFPFFKEDCLSIKEQVLYCSNDGYQICWLNFPNTFEEILASIKDRVNLYQVAVTLFK